MTDNQTFRDRLLTLIKALGLSVRSFEQKIDVSNGYIRSMKNGMSNKKLQNLKSAFPQVNISWLLNGTGDMFDNKNVELTEENSTDTDYSEVLKGLRTQINELKRLLDDELTQAKERERKLINIIEQLTK